MSKFEMAGTNKDIEFFSKKGCWGLRHIELNNEITQMADGFYQLEKDQEALQEFF
ncbi:hypothetical protein GCM10020331_072420 [Ectobacillus funiculus]